MVKGLVIILFLATVFLFTFHMYVNHCVIDNAIGIVAEEVKTPPLTSLPFQNRSTEVMEAIKEKAIEGVAITVLLHAPKWFQRRYTMMINNIIANIPKSWKVQLFYAPHGGSQIGIDINPGLSRLVKRGDLILTPIPKEIEKRCKRRIDMMMDRWLWENVLAEQVLVFGGNSAICSNSPFELQDFLHFDYVGAPWSACQGMGGDGGISLRKRSAMLAAIDAEHRLPNNLKPSFNGREDIFFVTRLRSLNSFGPHIYNIAQRIDTERFAAMDNKASYDAFAASGTLAALNWTHRETFINGCPEIKMIFPLLHDPACFGASPNAEQCAASICALKPKEQRKSGC